MKLPLAFFLEGIDEKKVYYFSSAKLQYSVCFVDVEKKR
jgi:hypothetical protein